MGRFLNDDTLGAVQTLVPIADGLGLSLAQLALAWVLREPTVASAIVGASRPGQLDDNVAAVGVVLDERTLAAIDDALAGRRQPGLTRRSRPCSGRLRGAPRRPARRSPRPGGAP